MALFVAGNLLTAVAPTYAAALLGRVVAALCHGSFFGIGSLVARRTVPPERASRAVAVMFAGLTAANVLGVPFGALLGERWGRRATFWVITGIGVVAAAALAVWVPAPAGSVREVHRAAGPRPRPHAFRSSQVWLTLTATALGYGGMFGAFSYLAYTFTEVTGFSGTDVAWLLVVYGTGLVVGDFAGGRAADRDRDRTLIGSLAGLAATLAVFGLLAESRVASVVLVFLTGVFGFAGGRHDHPCHRRHRRHPARRRQRVGLQRRQRPGGLAGRAPDQFRPGLHRAAVRGRSGRLARSGGDGGHRAHRVRRRARAGRLPPRGRRRRTGGRRCTAGSRTAARRAAVAAARRR